mgnify:CR=1 FL=1
MITPPTAPLTYLSPMRMSRWLPNTPSPSSPSIRTSALVSLAKVPSCHHHVVRRIANPPMSRRTEASTAENPLRASFWATIEPPQSTAAAMIAP